MNRALYVLVLGLGLSLFAGGCAAEGITDPIPVPPGPQPERERATKPLSGELDVPEKDTLEDFSNRPSLDVELFQNKPFDRPLPGPFAAD